MVTVMVSEVLELLFKSPAYDTVEETIKNKTLKTKSRK